MKKFCNEHAVVALASLVVLGMVVQLGVIAYVKITDYQNDKETVQLLRDRCEINKTDRRANAVGWRTAQVARMSTVAQNLGISMDEVEKRIEQKPQPSDSFDLVAARKYDRVAGGLERRSRINCAKAFPKAKFFG